MNTATRFAVLTLPVVLTATLAGAVSAQPKSDRHERTGEAEESVIRGSIAVGKAKQHEFSGLATIPLQDAIHRAVTTVPGKVLEAELEAENGYLVYAVSIAASDQTVTELTVDAGSGAILASEPGDEGHDADRDDEERDDQD